MSNLTLGAVESRFAEIVWQNEPMTTRELINLCEAELDWKRTTTYTVLKKLCDKGLFMTENGVVTAVMSKAQFCSGQSRQFVEESFGGSLPAFIAAFTAGKKLSAKEAEEIRRMIDEAGEE